jgi:hypothetical protein
MIPDKTAVAVFPGTRGEGCPDDAGKECSGFTWLLVGPKATVSYCFVGSAVEKRVASISVSESLNCLLDDEFVDQPTGRAVDDLKQLLRGPRIP